MRDNNRFSREDGIEIAGTGGAKPEMKVPEVLRELLHCMVAESVPSSIGKAEELAEKLSSLGVLADGVFASEMSGEDVADFGRRDGTEEPGW